MKVILVDDEKSMLLIMKKMILMFPEVEIAGTFQNSREAYRFLGENKVDLAFIDIKMPDENGLDLAKKIISEFDDIELVFLTSYKKYALDAFDVQAFDYLVKPVSMERLERTINRALQKFSAKKVIQEELSVKMTVLYLGGLDITDCNGEAIVLNSSKSLELLAYLILNRGRFVSKWSVMENVFPNMPVHNAETYLNTSIYKLRKALANHGINSVIISANESYRVSLENIYIDFIDFENRVEKLDNINDKNLEEALNAEKLFDGEMFGDKLFSWSISEKERLSIIYLELAKKLAAYLLNNNKVASALKILKKVQTLNEIDEETNCLILRLYAVKKDKLSLIRHYNKYSRVLKSELRIPPSKFIIQLYATLLKSIE